MSELLSAHRMSALFSGQITRDDGFPKKPDPAALTTMLEQHQLNPTETITLGDRDIVILAGQAAGLFSCFLGVEPGKCTPDLLFTKYDELDAFLLDRKKRNWSGW